MVVKLWTGNVKRSMRLIIMATQLAPTPVLYGVEAKQVMNELNMKANKQSVDKGNKLIDFFRKLEKK